MNKLVKTKLVRKALKLHVARFGDLNVAAKRVEFTAQSGEKLRDYITFRVTMDERKI
jgi:hypothetical protein|tara:strand:+ start:477 stop:647 length:171 start_codon:yes stop_codon:yes gene_type:complete